MIYTNMGHLHNGRGLAVAPTEASLIGGWKKMLKEWQGQWYSATNCNSYITLERAVEFYFKWTSKS